MRQDKSRSRRGRVGAKGRGRGGRQDGMVEHEGGKTGRRVPEDELRKKEST